MLRSPLRTSQLSRPTFLVILLATAAVLFLFNASTSNLNPSYGSRGIDARVGWNSDTYGEDDQLGFARKAGQALSGFGDRIGRLLLLVFQGAFAVSLSGLVALFTR